MNNKINNCQCSLYGNETCFCKGVLQKPDTAKLDDIINKLAAVDLTKLTDIIQLLRELRKVKCQ